MIVAFFRVSEKRDCDISGSEVEVITHQCRFSSSVVTEIAPWKVMLDLLPLLLEIRACFFYPFRHGDALKIGILNSFFKLPRATRTEKTGTLLRASRVC